MISADKLGVIYIHQHVLTNTPESRMKIDPDYKLDDSDKIVEELLLFHSLGGNTLLDCTALDYGRDARAMIEIAKRTPVNILALTGFNRGDYEEWVGTGEVSQFAEIMMRDIEEGMDGTTAKAALIKIGTCYNNILPAEYRMIEAAGIAHQKTGTPVITHTTLGTMGVEQVKALEKAGVDPSYIALSHLDQNLDFYYLNQIAETGAY